MMMPRVTADLSATRTLSPAALPRPEERRLVLVVVCGGTRRDYPLPDRGEVTIGRSDACEVSVAHPSLSRRHVTIVIGQDTLTLREEGSKNGTRLRGDHLAPKSEVTISPGAGAIPGDVFEPGALVCFVQARDAATRAPEPTPLRTELDALERQRILDALTQAGGNQTRAAKLLKMPRRTFILRLETYGVPRPRKR